MSFSKFQKEKCIKLIEKLISWPICAPFLDLETLKTDAPGYFDMISNPMALRVVLSNLKNMKYNDLKSFIKDVNLIWDNARKYNGEDSIYSQLAKESCLYFNRKMKTITSSPEEDWLMKVRKVATAFYSAISHPPQEVDPSRRIAEYAASV